MKTFVLALSFFASCSAMADYEKASAYIKINHCGKLSKEMTDFCKSVDVEAAMTPAAKLGTIVKDIPLEPEEIKVCGYVETKGQSLKISHFKQVYHVLACKYGCKDEKHFNLPKIYQPDQYVDVD